MAYSNLGQVIYPIGSIYMSTTPTSPASIFGGSWSRIEGAVLAANNGGYNTTFGGSKTIGNSQLPILSGQIQPHGNEAGSTLWNPTGVFSSSTIQNFYRQPVVAKTEGASSINMIKFSIGGGQNYYPYHYGVYCWRRTS